MIDVDSKNSFIPPVGDFPILQTRPHGKRFCYLDTAASAQKPQAVLDVMQHYHTQCYANVHRGAYQYAAELTAVVEQAREKIANYIRAESHEVFFTKNATEGFNMLAHSYGRHFLKKGDRVLLTVMEHHANMVPWQILRDEHGVVLDYLDIDDHGHLLLDDIEKKLSMAKLFCLTGQSNVTAVVPPVAALCQMAKQHGVVTIIDGTQSICHHKIDVKKIGCDFFIFSGHKLYGPTGVGVVYGRQEWLKQLPPFLGGGSMINKVTKDQTSFAEPPDRFEAGTPPIIEIVGLGAAIDWFSQFDIHQVAAHETHLANQLRQQLNHYKAIRILGQPIIDKTKDFASLVTFVMAGAHPHDLATLLDQSGIAVRGGHHCAQPLATRLGVSASLRVSFGIYNTEQDLDQFITGFDKALKILNLL